MSNQTLVLAKGRIVREYYTRTALREGVMVASGENVGQGTGSI